MKNQLNKLLNHPLATRTNAIALLIVGAILVVFGLWKKKGTMDQKITGNAPAGLKRTAKRYGVDFAKNIERMIRKETTHFTSDQWLGTGTAGMEATTEDFPFGWGSLAKFADGHNLTEKDFFLKQYTDNHDGRTPYFIGFKDTGVFVDFVSWFLHDVRGGDIVSWYRPNTPENATKRAKYASEMAKITPTFVNSFS